nr:MAG TPA: hypothetical protein [Caudoviricetes sp.]
MPEVMEDTAARRLPCASLLAAVATRCWSTR